MDSRKALVIVAGANLEEIRPPLALARFFFRNWDPSEVMIWEIAPPKDNVIAQKLETRKALALVAGGNLTEIRPPLELAQKWRFFFQKWGSSEVAIWKIVSTKVPQKRKIGKSKIPRNCSGQKYERNPPTVGACAEMFLFSKNGARRKSLI